MKVLGLFAGLALLVGCSQDVPAQVEEEVSFTFTSQGHLYDVLTDGTMIHWEDCPQCLDNNLQSK